MNSSTPNHPFDTSERPAAVLGGRTMGSRITLVMASGGGEVRHEKT